MQPTLHQHAGTPERDGLVNFGTDLVERSYVSLTVAGASVECTKCAHHVTHIGVVDVAIDDIGDDARRVPPLPNLVRGKADSNKIVRFKQDGAVIAGKAFASESFVQDRLNISHIYYALRVSASALLSTKAGPWQNFNGRTSEIIPCFFARK